MIDFLPAVRRAAAKPLFHPPSDSLAAMPPSFAEFPAQAWDLMRQTGSPPDAAAWIRPEVAHAWLRCIEEHGLPLGSDFAPAAGGPAADRAGPVGTELAALLDRIGPVLGEARLTLILATPEGILLHAEGPGLAGRSSTRELLRPGADWSESVLGNNGLGTAALTGRPAAFTGREHFSARLHPYATAGYPLEDPAGRIAGVIGLVGDRNVGAAVLLGVMGLIVRLLAADTPLRPPAGPASAARFTERRFGSVEPPLQAAAAGGEPSPAAYTDTIAEILVRQAVRLQSRNIPILFTGESGAGKEHLVRLIHAAGCRSRGPLIAINCASIPRDLIESELFGYEGGSFTGARSQGKPGKFLLADKGVLFLDEIGDMSFDLQATLLRVLESSEFVPVGGTRPIKVDVHVIAATNVRLLDAVEQGRFRRDLYYRLNGAQLRLPPLRERPDKRELIEYLLARECEGAGVAPKRLSRELREVFDCHPWPGNIRELLNLLRTLVSVVPAEVLAVRDLPEDFLEEMASSDLPPGEVPRQAGAMPAAAAPAESAASLEDWECRAIESALRRTAGNMTKSARLLGMARSTLYLKLQRYNLAPERGCG